MGIGCFMLSATEGLVDDNKNRRERKKKNDKLFSFILYATDNTLTCGDLAISSVLYCMKINTFGYNIVT